MSEQKKFKLSEITTTEKEDGEHMKYKYVPSSEADEKDISITVKGKSAALNLGLPTDMIGDNINIDFGATNKQTKLKKDATDKKGG